ncbi:hypothetical protein CL618_01830 [archaeon]|nr:hypothetical protein [archaeon]|tara:strand:- start:3237 stop:3626 length:390 start_codon:yes stop_codon:yes gene_type:complete
MALTTVELLALMFATIIIVKFVILLIKPKAWINMADNMFKDSKLTMWIYAALTIIVGYHIFNNYTIIDVAAIMLFTTVLIGLNYLPYKKHIMSMKKELTGNFFQKSWLAIIIWSVFALWVLYILIPKIL